MSRGVLDLRDALYFLGVIVIFLLLTRTALQSRTW
jgi:ABC-2 type transport system permease protein